MTQGGKLTEFIRRIPKTETHLHVEGALPYDLLTAWRPADYPPDPPFRRPSYRYPSFPDFEETLLRNALPWFDSPQRYHDATRVMFERHLALNVRYVETSFHLPVTRFINVPGEEIVAAIRAAVPPGLEVRIFAGMLRSDIAGELRPTIDRLGRWEGLAGVDLHGFEGMPTEAGTARVWEGLRAEGKVTKCHAGEFDGPARVREAIEVLGVRRIQHGVRAVEDPAVVALARDSGATFDTCPISNVRLRVVPSLGEHPLRRLMDAGIRCTVSTDDPLCFANTLADEYEALAAEAGFLPGELARLARNGWETADVAPADRARMCAEIDDALAACVAR
jgi:adenosine deaminase